MNKAMNKAVTGKPDKTQTIDHEKEDRERDTNKRADDFAPFFEQRGTLGLGLPNEGLAERIEKEWEDERRNR
jgi:hypothetical protein